MTVNQGWPQEETEERLRKTKLNKLTGPRSMRHGTTHGPGQQAEDKRGNFGPEPLLGHLREMKGRKG